jgi:hypothetical protein
LLLPLPAELREENMTLQWQNGLVSNFDYLLYLNSAADRFAPPQNLLSRVLAII